MGDRPYPWPHTASWTCWGALLGDVDFAALGGGESGFTDGHGFEHFDARSGISVSVCCIPSACVIRFGPRVVLRGYINPNRSPLA